MNEKHIFEAIGKILKQEFAKRDALIKELTEHKASDGVDGVDAEVDYIQVVELLKGNPKFMSSIKGKRGAGVTPADVLEAIKEDDGLLTQLKGEQGEEGAAEHVDYDGVLELLKGNDEFLKLVKGETGKDGDSVTLKELVDAMLPSLTKEFAEIVEHAVTVDYEILTGLVTDNKHFAKSLTGAAGKDADNELIINTLRADEEFQLALKGEQGAAGEDADSEAIYKALSISEEFQSGLKGEQGEQGVAGLGVDTPRWVAGVHRKGTFVAHHHGQHFKALQDTVGEPSSSQDWARVGTAGFRMTGAFKSEARYTEGDFFVKDFGLFLFSNEKANLIAGRGTSGKKGAKGDIGNRGASGTDGVDGSTLVSMDMKGTTVVSVYKNPQGGLQEYTLDLLPLVETLTSRTNKFIKDAPELVKGLINETMWVHSLSPEAIPFRFFRGLWYNDIQFQRGDAVIYDAGLYLAKKNNKGVLPKGLAIGAAKSTANWSFVGGWKIQGLAGSSTPPTSNDPAALQTIGGQNIVTLQGGTHDEPLPDDPIVEGVFTPINLVEAVENQMFVDVADDTLKFKNASGTVKTVKLI